MDILEKISAFKAVASGNAHPSILKDLLPASDVQEPNFIQLGVDSLLAERLQAASATKTRFRFRIVEKEPTDELEEVEVNGVKRQQRKVNEKVTFTEWMPEVTQFTAPMAMGNVRQQFPRGAVAIERTK